MLSGKKLKEVAERQGMTVEDLARSIVRGGLELKDAVSAVRNWVRGLYKPAPQTEDVRLLAAALSVEPREISDWHSSCRYAPMTARKARLVTDLILGRQVQETTCPSRVPSCFSVSGPNRGM